MRTAAAGYEPDALHREVRGVSGVLRATLPFSNPGREARALPPAAAAVACSSTTCWPARSGPGHRGGQVASANVSNAYGYYIDEFLWDNTRTCLRGGSRNLPGGNFIGRERVRGPWWDVMAGAARAASLTLHQKVHPW